jgi:hypothetical protein
MERRQFDPVTHMGTRCGVDRTTEFIRRLAREQLERPNWAIALQVDWQQREQQREGDFLVAVYGTKEHANGVPDYTIQSSLRWIRMEPTATIDDTPRRGIHPRDLAAFSVYISGYDMIVGLYVH